MMFPQSVKLCDTAKKSVRDWIKSLDLTSGEPDCCMTSSLSVSVRGSGIGDVFTFRFLGHQAIGYYDDDGGEWVLST